MNKQLLIEYIAPLDAKLTLSEGINVNSGVVKVKGKIQEAGNRDKINGNGRFYPRDVLEEALNRYNIEKISKRLALSELDHPDREIVELKNVAALLTKIWWEGDGVYGELELLNTPPGKIAQELVKQNIPLGISSRALGEVKTVNEVVEVQPGLDITAFDLVSIPSTPNAFLKPLQEGLSHQYQSSKYLTVNSIITDILCQKSTFCECQLK